MTTPITEPDSAGLVAHPHRMILWGAPDTAGYPSLCPNCGAEAFNALALSKGFVRRTRSKSSGKHIVLRASVPFCDPCIAEHASLVVGHGVRRLLPTLLMRETLGALAFGAAAAFTGHHALLELFSERVAQGGLLALLAAAFGAIAVHQGCAAFELIAYKLVPPQTAVTQAFDFSDNAPVALEAPNYTCTMRNAGFAQSFALANHEYECIPGSPCSTGGRRSAQRRAWEIATLITMLILGAIAFL